MGTQAPASISVSNFERQITFKVNTVQHVISRLMWWPEDPDTEKMTVCTVLMLSLFLGLLVQCRDSLTRPTCYKFGCHSEGQLSIPTLFSRHAMSVVLLSFCCTCFKYAIEPLVGCSDWTIVNNRLWAVGCSTFYYWISSPILNTDEGTVNSWFSESSLTGDDKKSC